ncbi:MAG: hypothetical protein JXM70_07480 [Pirellulales bacterium]|nr:hypothetical protein [Pirellulales bacterium]
MESIETRLARLESINTSFDYDKAEQYVMLLKAFIRKAEEYVYERGISEASPLFDITKRIEINMPESVALRVERFLEKKCDYPPSTKNVCRWFLKELFAVNSSSKDSHYEELIQLLENGGDFYEHHGTICIRDVAMLRYLK